MRDDATQSVLITGATGFIGSHLTRRVAEDGEAVQVVVRPDSDMSVLSDVRDRITVHVHDGSMAGMRDLLSGAAPACVFHLASLFISEHSAGDVAPLIESNVLFGTQLLDAMAAAGCTRIVNTGTAWQHYHNTAYSPVNLYAATKQAFEALMAYYVEARGFSAVTLNLFDTYGPHDRRRKLLRVLEDVARYGDPIDMTDGEQRIDLVHVDDVVDAFRVARDRVMQAQPATHERFGICSGAPVSLRELVQRFETARGVTIDARWGVRSYREREVMTPWTGCTPLPGWSPKIGLEEGLKRGIRVES
jgi:nucleoside-diphosphate-sugar epimerase